MAESTFGKQSRKIEISGTRFYPDFQASYSNFFFNYEGLRDSKNKRKFKMIKNVSKIYIFQSIILVVDFLSNLYKIRYMCILHGNENKDKSNIIFLLGCYASEICYNYACMHKISLYILYLFKLCYIQKM